MRCNVIMNRRCTTYCCWNSEYIGDGGDTKTGWAVLWMASWIGTLGKGGSLHGCEEKTHSPRNKEREATRPVNLEGRE